MSGEQRHPGVPQDPPWSLDLLADLHAGVLDQATADELNRQLDTDPEARAAFDALDAVGRDLADLPPLTIPDDVSTRIDAALADEVRAWSTSTSATPDSVEDAGAQVHSFAEARQRRRRFGWGAGLLTTAAAVAAVVVASTTLLNTGTGQEATGPSSVPSSASSALTLRGETVMLSPQQLTGALKAEEYGALSDPRQLLGCLQANGISSGKPMGAQKITFNGRPGELLILPTGQLGQFRLLAVGTDCGPGNPATLSDSTFGG